MYPVEFALRDKDKLNYRYPEGESYMDVVGRLEPVLEELNTETNLLIISHQATIRCLLTLLLNLPLDELPYLKIPLHTVMQLTFNEDGNGNEGPGGVCMQYIRLPVDCVDTYRPQPTNCSLDRKMEDACLTVPFHL
jgi:6-phosphofructo-2-kinase/fructose-2,6-biphosphatase